MSYELRIKNKLAINWLASKHVAGGVRYLVIIFLVFLMSASTVLADENSVQIINNVSSSASTGGNTVAAGQVAEGQSHSSVQVKTEINGQVIEDIRIEGGGGEEGPSAGSGQARVEVKTEVVANEEKAEVETTTIINGEENKMEKEVEFENKTIKTLDVSGASDILSVSGAPDAQNVQEMSDVQTAQEESDAQVLGQPDETQESKNIIALILLNIIESLKQSFLKIFSLFA